MRSAIGSNVFDWKAEDPRRFFRFRQGFDAVIGNPRYIRIQTMKEWAAPFPATLLDLSSSSPFAPSTSPTRPTGGRNRMVALVEEMLTLHRRRATARTDHERTNLKRKINAADRRIDRTVYDLYNLTEEEIRIVKRGQ